MRTAIRNLRLGLCVIAGAVAGCAEEPPAVVAAPAPPAPAPEAYVPPTVIALEKPPPEFCPTLAGIMAREPDGYAQLRGAPLGDGRWQAAAGLPGAERCTIEGRDWPRARVSCAGGPIEAGSRERVQDQFDLMMAQIDNCLNRAFWFPRDWRRGQLFEFAMDERQLAWIDETSNPPSAVVLKVHHDLMDQAYRLKVDLETVRR